jgi:hypothetical protein
MDSTLNQSKYILVGGNIYIKKQVNLDDLNQSLLTSIHDQSQQESL